MLLLKFMVSKLFILSEFNNYMNDNFIMNSISYSILFGIAYGLNKWMELSYIMGHNRVYAENSDYLNRRIKSLKREDCVYATVVTLHKFLSSDLDNFLFGGPPNEYCKTLERHWDKLKNDNPKSFIKAELTTFPTFRLAKKTLLDRLGI